MAHAEGLLANGPQRVYEFGLDWGARVMRSETNAAVEAIECRYATLAAEGILEAATAERLAVERAQQARRFISITHPSERSMHVGFAERVPRS